MDSSLLFPALARRRSSPQLAAARRSSPQLAAARRSSPLPTFRSRFAARVCDVVSQRGLCLLVGYVGRGWFAGCCWFALAGGQKFWWLGFRLSQCDLSFTSVFISVFISV